MKAAALKGAPVVSISDGTKLGYVADVLFDTRGLRIGALEIKTEGHRAVLPFDQISVLGDDAITVPDRSSIEGYEQLFAGLPNLNRIRRLKVIDDAGQFLGEVADLAIDVSSGRILEFTVHRGGMLGLGGTTVAVPVEAVRSIGDVMVVASGVAEPATDEVADRPIVHDPDLDRAQRRPEHEIGR